MILAGMQPYFFPYLGYFDLIYNADRWIVFDTPQYIKNGWVNRNRILHPSKGWQYVIVPLQKRALDTPINQIYICETQDWKSAILRQLFHYHKTAPRFKETISFVEDCLSGNDTLLYKLNIHILEKVCSLLEIPFNYSVFSEMNLELGPINKSGDWALRICQAVGATTLINPPGGRHLYDDQEFQGHGINLIIREFPNMVYSTQPYTFESALSIIDVMMWNTPFQIKDYLQLKCLKK